MIATQSISRCEVPSMIPGCVPSNRPTIETVLVRVGMKNSDNASFVEYFATSVAICDELIFSPGNTISET